MISGALWLTFYITDMIFNMIFTPKNIKVVVSKKKKKNHNSITLVGIMSKSTGKYTGT